MVTSLEPCKIYTADVSLTRAEDTGEHLSMNFFLFCFVLLLFFEYQGLDSGT